MTVVKLLSPFIIFLHSDAKSLKVEYCSWWIKGYKYTIERTLLGTRYWRSYPSACGCFCTSSSFPWGTGPNWDNQKCFSHFLVTISFVVELMHTRFVYCAYFMYFSRNNQDTELLTMHLIFRFWPFCLPSYSISTCGEVSWACDDLPHCWCMLPIPCDIQCNLFFPTTFMFCIHLF